MRPVQGERREDDRDGGAQETIQAQLVYTSVEL
jgi:hypothetical protein